MESYEQHTETAEIDSREALIVPDQYFPKHYGDRPYVYGGNTYDSLNAALNLERKFRGFAGSNIENDDPVLRAYAYAGGLAATESLDERDQWLIGRDVENLRALRKQYTPQIQG